MLKRLLSLFGLGRKRATLIVAVPPGRNGCGALRALDPDGKDLLGGSISIAARADEALAQRHGNPARDVLRPYGDPACGTYLLIAVDRLAGAPEALREEIGECQLLFEPSEGDAARAESGGRLMLALHGGRLGADLRLRASAGGLRVSGGDLETLLRVLPGQDEWRLEVREESPRMLSPQISGEPAGAAVDPPIAFSAEAQRAIEPAATRTRRPAQRSRRRPAPRRAPPPRKAQKYPSRQCLLPSRKAAQAPHRQAPRTLRAPRATDCRAPRRSRRRAFSLTSRALRAPEAATRSTLR